MVKKILAILLAFVYSVSYIVLGPMIKTQVISFDSSKILPFIVCFLLCSITNLVLFSVIPRCTFDVKKECFIHKVDKFSERKLCIWVWGFIFVSWLPAYCVFYPGILSYDMVSQVGSAMGEITNNHHPVLHTWLIRVFMNLGNNLFSSYEFGLGLLSLLQLLMVSYSLARLVALLKKHKVPTLIVLITALFSSIWFMNACLAMTMIKDTLFSAFFVLFACHFAEIVINPYEYSRQKRNLILLPIVGFFMCAFRNNGLHIYLFCFAGLLILRIKQIKNIKKYIALIAVILLPIFAFKIYSGPVFEAWNIEQGEVREALSVPIQQLQRVAVQNGIELNSEQTELMDYYIDNLMWRSWEPGRKYEPFIADPAKSCFFSGRYNEDPIAFWKFYLQIGEQFTKQYIVAFLSNSLGFWYPGYDSFSYVEYENYPSEWFVVPLERMSIGNLAFMDKYYESVCRDAFWREIPAIRLFFLPGFTPWILVYALILSWRKKKYFTMIFPLFLPHIAQIGIMMLSPIASFRYSWPFYLILPLAFIGIWGNRELNEVEEKDTIMCPENVNDACKN